MRYCSLQILRGIAAWSILYYHYIQDFYQFNVSHPVARIFASHGSLGVDIFFVLSGFVMYLSAAKTDTTAYDFFLRRVFRIVPAYWFYTIVMAISIELIPEECDASTYSLKTFFYSLAFIPHQNPSGLGRYSLLTVGWTLQFEMVFYTIYTIAIAISKRHAALLCTVAVLLLSLPWPIIGRFSVPFPSYRMCEFVCGMVLARLLSTTRSHHSQKYWSITWLTLLTIATFYVSYVSVNLSLKKMLIATFIVGICVVGNQYLTGDSRLKRFFVGLGDCSYSTYLVHAIVTAYALHLFGNQLGRPMEYIVLVAISMSTYAISIISYKFVERNQTLRAIETRFLRSRHLPITET